jgi:hypothetical protein
VPSSGDRYLGADPVALLALAGTTELASLALHRAVAEVRHALADAGMASDFPTPMLTVEDWVTGAQGDLLRRAADLAAERLTPTNIGHALNWFARRSWPWLLPATETVHRIQHLGPPVVGMVIDVEQLVHPPHTGVRGEVDRVVAGVGLAAGAATVAAGVGMVGPPAAAVAGAVEAGAAVYQAGNFVYDHRRTVAHLLHEIGIGRAVAA